MNVQSIILLAAVLALAAWVLRFHLKKRREGGGCGSCHGCSGCPGREGQCRKANRRRK